MKRLKKEIIGAGKWLCLSELHYLGHDGVERTWETVARQNSRGAVGILAAMKDSGEIVLIRQYRPPVDCFVIEFPAGLIDDGETPESAAIRELREETGFTGKLLEITQRAYSSPGLTDEFLIFAKIEVDGKTETDFDESESIETFLVKPEDLNGFIAQARSRGDAIDAKVMAYAFAKTF